jgi:endo-1,4-beta-xylanase
VRIKEIILFLSVCLAIDCISSCKKTSSGGGGVIVPPTPNPFDTTGTGPLKNGAAFNVGLAIDYAQYKNDANYAALVNREANNVTFGYQMKHGAIVKNDGSFDFSKTDEMVNQANAAGLWIYGHTLTWHQNNNGDYLRSLATIAGSTDVFAGQNGDFESGTATSFAPYWARLANAPAAATYEVETTAPAQGTRSFKVTVTALGANPYDVQMIQNNSPTNYWPGVMGTQYVIKLWAKTSTAGGSLRVINQVGSGSTLTPNYDLYPTSSWTEYTIPFTCAESNPTLKFWFNKLGTYWIDDIRIYQGSTAPPGSAAAAEQVDSALRKWIRASVTRYPGKVKAWDVVNEPYTDGSAPILRNGSGTTGDTYYWAEFLGRSYITKAFNYARENDATADLFLNDYNLEFNIAKLDSFVNLANQLKASGVPITGVGTQMHININTDIAGINAMFIKLAATGLKVRISELDIRINPTNITGFIPTQSQLDAQASMYRSVLQSYYQNVPAGQRYAVTVWGVTDNYSWIVVTQGHEDFPLLFDQNYRKKSAYTGLWKGLKQL